MNHCKMRYFYANTVLTGLDITSLVSGSGAAIEDTATMKSAKATITIFWDMFYFYLCSLVSCDYDPMGQHNTLLRRKLSHTSCQNWKISVLPSF